MDSAPSGQPPIDGAVYRAVLDEITALRALRRSGKVKEDEFMALANLILAKLGPGWRVYETPRPPLDAHEVMRRELTQRLGRQVVAPPRPAMPPGNVLSRELVAEAAYLFVSTQFGSPQMIERELKTKRSSSARSCTFCTASVFWGPLRGLRRARSFGRLGARRRCAA